MKDLNDPICDKKTSLKLFDALSLKFFPDFHLEYSYPDFKLWNGSLLEKIDDRILLNIISDFPFYGFKDSIHFVAECQEGLAYHVFVGNYSNIFKIDNFFKGEQIICPRRSSVSPSNILSVYCLGNEVEIYSKNFYNLTAENYKLKGNNEFSKGKYELAVLYFSKAIEFDSSNEIYYLNRSNAYLKEKNFVKSYLDSSKAFSLNKFNIKSIYRQALSLFELEEYEKSLEILKKYSDLIKHDEPSIGIFRDLISKVENFIENTKGIYNSDFYKSLMDYENNNFANYISDKIEIKHSKLQGKGIFAKEDIQPGELIVLERAFYSEKLNSSSGDELLSKIFLNLKNNIIALTRLNFLNEPNHTDINTFKHGLFFRDKIYEKKLDFVKLRNQIILSLQSKSFKSEDRDSLCLICSLFNNSCLPTNNVEYVEVKGKRNDIMIVQSKSLIKKGEELLINYECGITSYKDRKYYFNQWGFDCRCNFCIVDKEMNFGENIKNHKNKCLKLIDENKMEESLAALDDFLSYIFKIDKNLIISEIYNTINPIFTIFSTKFPNLHEIKSKKKSFLLDFLNYNDRGFFYHQILKFYAPQLIEYEILKNYQSNCCKLAVDLIDKVNLN